ncbi:3-hydroxyacyl-ACP dehydratase, partial [Staphylococcus aureus]
MDTIFDYKQIKQIIPHRQPFVLSDKVVEYEEGQRCVAIKQLSGNEPFSQGHFPEYAVMSGVLITEVLAQTGAVAILK